MKVSPQLYTYGIMTAIIALIVFLLLKRVGLIKDAAQRLAAKDKAESLANLQNEPSFNPNEYKSLNLGLSFLLPNSEANSKAKAIYNSFGFFNDDEEGLYSIFRSFTNKAQISQVSDAFTQLYEKDMLGVITDYLNASERAFLWNIINQIPEAKR